MTPRTLLSDLCTSYIAARELSESYRGFLTRAVRGLEWVADRALYVDEIDQQLIDTWLAAERTRRAEATIEPILDGAKALWAQAWAAGLNHHKPADDRRWIESGGARRVLRGRMPVGRRSAAEKDCSPGSLRKLLREQYRPRRLLGKSPEGSRLHEVALNNFERFLGRTATLGDLDDDVICRLMAWLLDRGACPRRSTAAGIGCSRCGDSQPASGSWKSGPTSSR